MAFRTTQIGILLLLTACGASRNVYVDVQHPPRIPMDEASGKVLIVNRLDPSKLEFDNDNKTEIYHMAIVNYLEGLADGITKQTNYSPQIIKGPVFVSDNPREDALPLETGKVGMLQDDEGSILLLALDKLDIGFTRTTEKDEEGDKTMHSSLVLHTTVTVYDPLGNIKTRIWESDDVYHESRAVESGLLAVGPSLGKADENARMLSFELGSSFAGHFQPTSTKEVRRLFTDKEFGSLNGYEVRSRKDEFIQFLIPWTENNDRTLAGHACYNIAVIYEAAGDPGMANEWYGRAGELIDLPGK